MRAEGWVIRTVEDSDFFDTVQYSSLPSSLIPHPSALIPHPSSFIAAGTLSMISKASRSLSPPAPISLNLRAVTKTLFSNEPTALLKALTVESRPFRISSKCEPNTRILSYRVFPRLLIFWAFSAISSCLHPYATARSKAIKVVGVANITLWSTPHWISSGSCSNAALKKVSPGKKSTTNSGACANWSQ